MPRPVRPITQPPLIVEEASKEWQLYGRMNSMWDVGGQAEIDSRVSRSIYAHRVPFNVVHSPY